MNSNWTLTTNEDQSKYIIILAVLTLAAECLDQEACTPTVSIEECRELCGVHVQSWTPTLCTCEKSE